jgi:hypothetical protein
MVSSDFSEASGDRGGTHGLAHGVDLRDLTTTRHADADVDGGELIDPEKEDGLVELGPENLGGEELDGGAVHPDEALAGHHARDGCKQIGSAPQFRGGWSFVRAWECVPVAFFFLPKTWTACAGVDAMVTVMARMSSCLVVPA